MDVHGLRSQAWADMVRSRYPEIRSTRHLRTIKDDFPTYRCTSCGRLLRLAKEAYELEKCINEEHPWACEECVYGRLGLLW
jgi:DNA-directed RNA polymerase subunit RPC12/RpoP